MKLIIIY